jgi:hypothetical protein
MAWSCAPNRGLPRRRPLQDEEQLAQVIRTGSGFGWGEHHHDLYAGVGDVAEGPRRCGTSFRPEHWS